MCLKYNHTLCNVAGEQIWIEMIFLKLTFDPMFCSSTATLKRCYFMICKIFRCVEAL